MNQLNFVVTPHNGAARRLVMVFENGAEVFRDKVDVDNANARKRFFEGLGQTLQRPGQELVHAFEGLLLKLADEADKAAAEQAARGNGNSTDPFEIACREIEKTPPEIVTEAERMANSPELLREVYQDICTLGVAGEAETALTVWLVGVSRLLTSPLAAVIVGPTSSGKSYVLEKVGALFPPEAKIKLTQASPNSWFYLPPGSLRHRFVVLGERPQGETPEVVDANRSWRELVSEGRLVKAVATRGLDGRMTTEVVIQEGPVAFCESTTKSKLLDEDASRMLILNSDDSAEQTRLVISKLFSDASNPQSKNSEMIIAKHWAFQRLISSHPPQVVIPFAEQLAEKFPADRPECRRIARHCVALIRANAVAHQFQRERDGEAIIADPPDYYVAYRLLQRPAARLLGREVHTSFERLLEKLKEAVSDGEFSTREAAGIGGMTPQWTRQALRALAEQGAIEQVSPGGGPKSATWRIIGEYHGRGVLPEPEGVCSLNQKSFCFLPVSHFPLGASCELNTTKAESGITFH